MVKLVNCVNGKVNKVGWFILENRIKHINWVDRLLGKTGPLSKMGELDETGKTGKDRGYCNACCKRSSTTYGRPQLAGLQESAKIPGW